MKRKHWIFAVVAASLVALGVHLQGRSSLRAGGGSTPKASAVEALLTPLGGDSTRTGREPGAPAPEYVELPETRSAPRSEHDLLELVAWMRTLSTEELLRLSNAEFDFEQSELVEMLQGLEGPWVVEVLGGLAVEESDPLLKAILVEGLAGAFDSARLGDPKLVPILASLMGQMNLAAADPYGVAGTLAFCAYGTCLVGEQDYVALMSGHLEASDNRDFLSVGYLMMGNFPGGPEVLEGMLTEHSSADGRFGALEGLRHSPDGSVPPDQITALGLTALESETHQRNRLLLYEMIVSRGGPAALDAIEQAWRAGETSDIDKTATLLALRMEPARAQALFQETLQESELDPAARQAIYNAMGAMPGEEGAALLLEVVRDEDLAPEERLAGLRGLWNREVDGELAGELEAILTNSDDPAMRVEALRMLAHGEAAGTGVDLRSLATLDDSPAVRAEAVQLAAMQPGEGTREWLEERLLEDDSLDVKAAALGSLVYHAHYTGDGDAVLGYLSRARELTDDEAALAMIARGEEMVKSYDPRNLELGLAQEAEFLETVARLTDGPASRAFQRQARTLSGLVAALRAAQPGRSATR